jgi:hypothetical protein
MCLGKIISELSVEIFSIAYYYQTTIGGVKLLYPYFGDSKKETIYRKKHIEDIYCRNRFMTHPFRG